MPLVLPMNQDPNDPEYWLSGKDQVFSDSPFFGEDFRVKIKPLTRSAKEVIERKHTTIKRNVQCANFDAIAKEVFMKHVVDWEGIAIPDPTEANGFKTLKCNEDMKSLVVEKMFPFADTIAAAILDPFGTKKNREDKAAELGNS